MYVFTVDKQQYTERVYEVKITKTETKLAP